MFQALLWAGAGLWGLFLVQAVVNRLLLRDLSKMPIPGDGSAGRGSTGPTPFTSVSPGKGGRPGSDWPFVSLVVPARNEDRGIREAVRSLCRQDYPAQSAAGSVDGADGVRRYGFEVIVVDDRSTDSTPAILAELSREFPNLRVVQGTDPPPGWLGKTNALETGRRNARRATAGAAPANAEWFLFADADVIYAPDLLRRAVGYAREHDLAMLTLCPRLWTKGVVEAALMFSLYLVSLAIVPMFLVNWRRVRGFAAGGGAFNLVRRDAVQAVGAFASMPDSIIDDVTLGCKVKSAGFAYRLCLAGPLIRLRMYDGARAAVEGFAKNTFPAMVRRPWTLGFHLALSVLITYLPYAGFAAGLLRGSPNFPATIALVLMHLVSGGLAWWFRQPWYVAFLNPVRELGWGWILLRSAARYYRRGLVWRGRTYGSVDTLAAGGAGATEGAASGGMDHAGVAMPEAGSTRTPGDRPAHVEMWVAPTGATRPGSDLV